MVGFPSQTRLARLLAFASMAALGLPAQQATAREYPLDGVSRHISHSKGKVSCPEVPLRVYRGTHARYQKAMRTNVYIVPQIAKFEALVDELSVKYYGREPQRIVHLGSYNCRESRGRRPRLSEHALGNAIDISAFRFRRAPRKVRSQLEPSLRRPFTVSVLRHWSDDTSVHGCFLRELVSEVMRRKIFRSVIGPGNPKHDNHLHLDMSPWSVRQIELSNTEAMCGFSPPVRRRWFDWF